MRFSYLLILFAIFGCIAVIMIMFVGLIWACGIAFLVFMMGLALSIEIYMKERRARKAQRVESSEPKYAEASGPSFQMQIENGVEGAGYKQELRKIRINSYMKYFGIDEIRAAALYDAGYNNLSKLSKAEISKLIAIPAINPTLAKKIVIQLRGKAD
ncbi:MAG: helix-hairpin-helix domain-containing protein [Thermoplasmata archaeon]|nr:helix-hairpin-helix domain-containing protein [Thermoplasmata archaeon]